MHRQRTPVYCIFLQSTLVALLALLGGCGGGAAEAPVQPPAAPTSVPEKPATGPTATITLTATPQTVAAGHLVTLNWKTADRGPSAVRRALQPNDGPEPALP